MTAPLPSIVRSPALSPLRISGPDAASFLHNQLSTDVAGMAVGDAGFTGYHSPKGRLLATPLLWRRQESEFVAYVPPDIAEPLRKRLSMFVLRAKVAIEAPASRVLTGVAGTGGDSAIAAVAGDAPAPGHGIAGSEWDVIALPDGRYLVDGVRAWPLDGDDAPPAHWEWLGIRAGVPQIVLATQDAFVPQTANLDLVGGINFRKGCYPGQEIVARMQYLGRLKERMFAFHADGDPPAPGAAIVAGEEKAGTVVNAAPAPGGGSDLLAIVTFAALEAGGLRIADGADLVPIALPYAVPAPSAPNRVKL
jgi:folate-binding protein YgfZ